MKKYELRPVTQNNKTFYVMIADPRIIVRLLENYKAGQEQEAQRPWNETRVKEISKFVAGKFKGENNQKANGLIPNAPIINIKNNLKIEKDDGGYYIMLPSLGNEFEQNIGSVEAIDGQHRIRAFMEEYRDPDFIDSKKYEMIFSVFDKLSLDEKKEIFMVTNENQIKVPGNLLRMFRRELNLLKDDEEVYDLVTKLNYEDFSPLKGRIMIGAKKISKGYQESQVSKILNKSDSFKEVQSLCGKDNVATMAKLISNYLSAWEQVYDVSFLNPGKETITKISGLRYILFLLPTILGILSNRKKTAKTEEFKRLIEVIPDATEITNIFADDKSSNFRGESATIKYAKEHARLIKAYTVKNTEGFDMTDGI